MAAALLVGCASSDDSGGAEGVPMDHPFHQHGFFFQARSSAGASPLVWKDTVIVRSGSKLELVSRYDELGHWMYHCHILEHAEGGMMGAITVH